MRDRYSIISRIINMLIIVFLTILAMTIYNNAREKNTFKNDALSLINDYRITTNNIADSSLNIDVNIKYAFTLDDKVKGTSGHIIKAIKQAFFDDACLTETISKYNGLKIDNDVYIFEIDKVDDNTWKVKFWEKEHGAKDYLKDGYYTMTVQKLKSGLYKGYIPRHGYPLIAGEEIIDN